MPLRERLRALDIERVSRSGPDPVPAPSTTLPGLEWAAVANVDTVESPALLFYPDRIAENLRRMIAIAGDAGRLRPHVKTHKAARVVEMMLQAGITKFKCATIAEAETIASAGGRDVLLAYQPVGPNVSRLRQLTVRFPVTRFLTIVDDPGATRTLAREFDAAGARVDVLVDLDCGMHRTGIAPGAEAHALCRLVDELPGLRFRGLHVYDGHINATATDERAAQWRAAMAPVTEFRARLQAKGPAAAEMVAGGTPTFPWHAATPGVECSPGTCVLWDYGYATKLPDLDFLWAALVLTRVIGRPGSGRLCLDLGNKAIASEGPHPRVYLPALPDARALNHSEEHLVLEAADAGRFRVGDPLYGVPMHICPTCAAHQEAVVVVQGRAAERWPITARDRRLHI